VKKLSESESELKKRMWQKLGNQYCFDVMQGKMTSNDVDKLFQEILDEANTEFPQLEPIVIQQGQSLPNDLHQRIAEEHAIKYISEVQAWRKKWLGSIKEEVEIGGEVG